LPSVYDDLAKEVQGTKSEEYIQVTLEKLANTNRPPESFNDGLNDGPAAGQTVPHFHWHIMPRWEGDVADPRGGIRHMFPSLGNYHTGIIAQDH
jgi:diadenosine tetraphosphate (Ap4A) HIT family hydrolase